MSILTAHASGEAGSAALAKTLSGHLRPGDTILLEGGVGAGKSFFARAIITQLLADEGRAEDVPSPTFTLVQTYETEGAEIWHADLYRLSDASELEELGLIEAFETAICLIEWPERLGALRPQRCLTIGIEEGYAVDHRVLNFRAEGPGWDWLAGIG